MKTWEIIVCILIAVLAGIVLVSYFHRSLQCDAAGGVFVRTAFGYACIQGKVVK